MARSRGSIKKRGDRRYLIRIYTGVNEDGKRTYYNKTIHGTKKDAERHRTKVLREMDLGTFAEPSRESLNTHLDEWLKVAAEPRVRPQTLASYREMLNLYIRPDLGQKLISKLTPVEIQRCYNALSGRGLSARTVKYAHTVLNMALKQAVRWKKIQFNPASIANLPRGETPETTVLSEGELRKFLAVAEEGPLYAFFLLAVSTGMRSGELLGLQWTDIDLGRRVLSVRRSLTRLDGEWRFNDPKTSRSRRQIALSPTVVEVLRRHRSVQAKIRLAAGADYDNHDLVFANDVGEPLDHKNIVRRHFKPLLRSARLPDIRFYDLRHTHATLLLQNGENVKVVSERLGHSSVVLTMDTYQHVLPDMQRRSADKFEAVLFGNTRE